MKIQRIINGTEVEIELTEEEIRSCYWQADKLLTAEDIQNTYDVSKSQALRASEKVADILSECDAYEDIYWDTIKLVCGLLGYKEA